jgi:hypothetical protein
MAGLGHEGYRDTTKRRPMSLFKVFCAVLMLIILAGMPERALGVESGQFRLLSIADTSKLILVSQIPSKTKYLLDASTAKITVDGKPAEFKTLDYYAIINIKFELKKGSKEGIETNGVATEIRIVVQENKK